MRVAAEAGGFRAKGISGTHVVLIALDCDDSARAGLMGFAFQREVVGGRGRGSKWLNAQKVFKSVVPDPKAERDPKDPTQPRRYSTLEHPIQSFLWGDYTAEPDTTYRFTIFPMRGKPGALEQGKPVSIEIRTEKELDRGHGVWFNRGAIASQAFARKFGNKALTDEEKNDPDFPETKWLSRGLIEACLGYIDETPAGDGLRVAAYEFTYPPVLDALKAALDRGVDVRIVYHDTSDGDGANEKAIKTAGLPREVRSRQVLFPRSKTKIPHNKFIVRLKGGRDPVEVWTGSTNFTWSGFIGQTNVGYRVQDAATAEQYLKYWEVLKTDPELDDARESAMQLTPDPAAVIDPNSIVQVFSPRPKATLLSWYGARMLNGVTSVMFTAAFGIARQLTGSIADKRDALRFVLMEKPVTPEAKRELTQDRNRVILSYGVPLGEIYEIKNGKVASRKRIQEFDLDKQFFKEEHFRKKNDGFVFFVHTKFLLIDPLSDDPLVCSGSANFSSNSLLQNDENMLLVRGDTRVADIYMTEFDRIFRHFYFRDVANEIEAKGGKAAGAFLDETDAWTESYFKPGAFKTLRREMFFATPATTWFANAALPAKKGAAKKGAAKKGAAKKGAAKKGAAKKGGAKASAKKGAARKGGAAKAARGGAKKGPAQKRAAKKAATKTGAAKRTSANKGRKTPAKATKRGAAKRATGSRGRPASKAAAKRGTKGAGRKSRG
jgi:phosphatidylserine/phosphatidylglycerophosphate/cardiolipin synthase-like enzyme